MAMSHSTGWDAFAEEEERRRFNQRWTSYPWRAGSPADSAHALSGSSLDGRRERSR